MPQKSNWQITDEEAQRTLAAIQDPLFLIEHGLGVNLWDKQKEIVESVWKHKYTAVKASYNVGKTFVAASITLAWLLPNKNSKAITTAPTAKQVEDLLWGEIGSMVSNSKIPLWEPGSGVKLNQTDLVIDGKKWYATGISVQIGAEEQSAVRISGYHAPMILVVIDEATGVHPAIWKALNGLMSGANTRMLAITNPRTNLCEFKTFCQDPRVNVITISAFDHPNIKTGKEIIPGSVDIEWVEDMVLKHCEEVKHHSAEDMTFEWKGKIYKPDDTALWELCGEFPRVSDELFFSMLNPKIHHFPAKDVPDDAVTIPSFMDYGNWNALYYAKMDNNGNIYVMNEFICIKGEMQERAEKFRNWCFYHGYRDFTVVGDTDMYAEPAPAYHTGGNKPVVETFKRVCNDDAQLPNGEKFIGLGINFVKAIKSKTEGYTYRKYCNRQVKDRLNWRKDSQTEWWLLKPTLYIDKEACPYIYATVLGKTQSGITQKLDGVAEDTPGLIKSLLYEEDFDQTIGIDHPIDALKGLVTSAPHRAEKPKSQEQSNEELRRQIAESFKRGM